VKRSLKDEMAPPKDLLIIVENLKGWLLFQTCEMIVS
jgi:hypothetical protein